LFCRLTVGVLSANSGPAMRVMLWCEEAYLRYLGEVARVVGCFYLTRKNAMSFIS